MAKASVILDQRNKEATSFPVKIRLSHKGLKRYILTGYAITPEMWDGSKIIKPFKNCGRANGKISSMLAIAENVVEELRPHENELTADNYKTLTEKAIKENQEDKKKSLKKAGLDRVLNNPIDTTPCYYKYAQMVADRLYLEKRGGSADLIEQSITQLKAFSGKQTLPFSHITETLLNDFERWYLGKTNKEGKPNSISSLGFFMKEIRAVFNVAIKDDNCVVTQEMYPFGRKGYSVKTVKRKPKNIDLSEIAKIYDLQLPEGSSLWHHQQFFLYYFECWGMNFADAAHLKVYQVQNGRTQYKRRKTRYATSPKEFDIVHTPLMQAIVDYFTKGKSQGDYVFPILDSVSYLLQEVKNEKGERDIEAEINNGKLFQKRFKHIRSNHIRRLTKVAKEAGLSSHLTTYIGRHTFFSSLLKSGVSKSEISEMAGHADFKTTENYLDGFESARLNESANKVREAIALNRVSNDNDPLSQKLLVTISNTLVSVRDFINGVAGSKRLSDALKSQILFKIISETNCKDGERAMALIEAFRDDKSKHLKVVSKSA